MSLFIVGPPIQNDLDYYRFDDDIVKRVLDGNSLLALGLRRSGKTSFLYRIKRAANNADKPVELFDIGDIFTSDNPAKEVKNAIYQIKDNPKAIVLLDEAEAFKRANKRLLAKFIGACRTKTVVMTCAPVFVLEPQEQPEIVRKFTENFPHHHLRPLSQDEVFALLSRFKRREESPVNKEVIEKIWQSGDRLPIILQALGAYHAEGKDPSVSLAGVGGYILMGLTPKAKGSLVQAAHGGSPDPTSYEVKLLTALGAFHQEQDSIGVRIGGQTLGDIIRASCPLPAMKNKDEADGTGSHRTWKLYSRILHISDLHFGSHCIEPNTIDQQLSRLKAVIERDKILPDFIAVTGDLSWSGHRKDLKAAEDFLEGLVTWYAKFRHCGVQEARQRILIIPGNHEAAWSLTNGLSPEETEDWVWYSMAPFANFINRFYRGAVFWDLEHPFQSRFFEKPSLTFILISTSHLITKNRKHGEFGDHVQEEVVKLFDQSDIKKARFRIGMIHHNLRAFHTDGQLICDGEGAILRLARCKPTLDLILHGHVHQGEVDVFKPREGYKEIPYSAVGSFGVRAEHRPGDDIKGRVENEFSIVDLETSGKYSRFTTQFYHLKYTTTGNWEWKVGPKSDPRNI